MATSTLKDIDLASLRMPFPAMSFILPVGGFKTPHDPPDGEDVPFISIALDLRGRKRIDFCPLTHKGLDVVTADDAILVSAMLPRHFVTLTMRITQEWINKIDELPESFEWRDFFVGAEGKQIASKLSDRQNIFANNMVRIVTNLILAMEARPELLTRERFKKHIRRDRHYEVWTPNVLGAKYRLQYQNGAGHVERGEHASPIMHWRRGHFRRQGVGERIDACVDCNCSRKIHANVDHSGYCQKPDCECEQYVAPTQKFHDYKTLWLEPILVNAPKAKEKNGQS
jgi:hypothetical protein